MPNAQDEPPQVFTDRDGVKWLRTGYCCRCGECCRGNPFTGEAHGFCPLFRWAAEGLGECTDRAHLLYLNGCHIWPTHPKHLREYPKCTYRFTKLEEASDGVSGHLQPAA